MSFVDQVQLSQKKSAARQLIEFAEQHGTEGVFLSFTKLDKLGVYPQSSYYTPLGIYAYPLDYVIDEIKDTLKFKNGGYPHLSNVVPFAGNSPFLTLFKCNGNVIDLQQTSKLKTITKLIRGDFRIDEIPPAYKQSTPAWNFWSTTLFIANGQNPTPKTSSPNDKTAPRTADGLPISNDHVTYREIPVKWNALFRNLGIDGVVDSAGYEVIHQNEPIQAVFFSLDKLEVITRITNTLEGSPTKVKKFGTGNQRLHYQVQGSPSVTKLKHSMMDFIWKKVIQQAQRANQRRSNFKLYLGSFHFLTPDFWETTESIIRGDKFLFKVISSIAPDDKEAFDDFVKELTQQLSGVVESVEMLCNYFIGLRVVKPTDVDYNIYQRSDDREAALAAKERFDSVDFEKEILKQEKDLKEKISGRIYRSINDAIENWKTQ